MNKTRKSLWTGPVAIVLCFAMLVGTTFAWFTDSVTSANNKIQSGNLVVDLELLDKETGEWNSLKGDTTPIYDYDKWEPGYTDVKVFKVLNEGTLALKWDLDIVTSTKLTELANVIDVYVSQGAEAYPTTREEVKGWTNAGTILEFVAGVNEDVYNVLEAGESKTLAVALVMREEAGNEYQDMDLCGKFDIQIKATQATVEEDSFDDQYDVDATYPVIPREITDAEDLTNAGTVSGTYVLINDVTVDSFNTAADTDVVIDLNDNGITTGDTVYTYGDVELSNGTLTNTSTSGRYALLALGDETVIDDVDVVTSGGGVNIQNGTAVFNGGSITTNSVTTNPRHVFYVWDSTGEGTTLTINDGTFTFNPKNLTRKGSYLVADQGATIIVNGGTFNAPSTRTAPIQELNGGNVEIYGGTFKFDVSAYVAEGYEAVETDGWWTVSAK